MRTYLIELIKTRNWIFSLAFLLIPLGVFVLVLVLVTRGDYLRLQEIRQMSLKIQPGMTEKETLDCIGDPDFISKNRVMIHQNITQSDYTVWTYCSRFDWDGFRYRSQISNPLFYWLSRLNPSKDTNYDTISEIWLKDGVVVETKRFDEAKSIGERSLFSIPP